MGYESAIKPGVNRMASWRRQVQKPVLSLEEVIPSDPSLLDDAVAEITATIDRTACWEDVESIGLAVREAVANAIVHGNRSEPEKAVRVSVALCENCDLLIIVRDSGSGFDPRQASRPTCCGESAGQPRRRTYSCETAENLTAGALENARENRRLVLQQKGAKGDGENQPQILGAIAGQHFQSYEVHGAASVVPVYR